MFDEAMQLFEQGDYEKSYFLLERILQNPNSSSFEKSDAYNLMGAIIIGPAPQLCEKTNEIEEALLLFKTALIKNEDNIGALLNIVETFGVGFNQHSDKNSFIHSYEKLMKKYKKQLSQYDIDRIKEKYIIYTSMYTKEENK